MIIDDAALTRLAGDPSARFAMVDGCFDPLHEGHVAYVRAAAALGMPLVCNVRGDAYIRNAKGREPLLDEARRAAVLDGLKGVEHVYVCNTSTDDVLRRLRPARYVKGSDWRARELPAAERATCAEFGIEIVYLDTVLDSSTKVAGDFLRRQNAGVEAAAVAGFEELLRTQRPYESGYYDEQYFQGDWRSEGNAYHLERRREIEGRNPHNIVEIFAPRSVLDVGCGPGALMLFLHELGVDVWGVDFSTAARDAAHESVRERIRVGQVTEYHDFGREFDLVICRETLEHLTVLQVRRAVAALARATSRYLYVTTRFHPEPRTLLDVTDQPDVDPSHITLLNKNLLRVLFALEGLVSRPDLEARLDWKGYGRVLAFEKPAGA